MSWTLTDTVVNDDEWSMPVEHHELIETANEAGRAHPRFAAPVTIRALIRPDSATEFQVIPEGQLDSADLWMVVDDAHGVENDDRIVFRDVAFRATQRQTEYVDGFSVFALIEDSRTQLADSSKAGTEEATSAADSEFTRDYEVL